MATIQLPAARRKQGGIPAAPVPAWRRKHSVRISPARRDREPSQEEEEGQGECVRVQFDLFFEEFLLHGDGKMTSTASERRAFAHKINR